MSSSSAGESAPSTSDRTDERERNEDAVRGTQPGGAIREIHLHNFKSWGGTQVVGPFKTFSCIIGSNGSGKSNLMDAISFVLGVRTQQLRGSRLRDLVHRGVESDVPKDRGAYVKLVYDHGDNETTVFKRSISRDKAQYWINDEAVAWRQYENRLKDFGVIVRARNFLVFQGDVESIAAKTPAQLTELFEQISGSSQLREKYDELMEKAKEAESLFIRSFDKKRNVTKEKKQVKEQKEEAERFQRLQQDFRKQQQQFFLWQLFHIDLAMERHSDTIRDQRDIEQEKATRCEEKQNQLKKAGQLSGKIRRQRTSLEKELSKVTRKIENERTNMIKLEEHSTHLKVGLRDLEEAFEQSKVDDIRHGEILESLQEELATVEALADDVERGIRNENSGELHMAQAQLQEYEDCKRRAAETTARLRQDRDRLRNEIRAAQSSVEEMESRLESLQSHKKQLLEFREKSLEKQQKMEKHISDSEVKLEELEKSLEAIKMKQEQTASERDDLNRQLVQIERELLGIRVDRVESERETRLSEAVASLQRLYPGVKGRLSSLARPIQRRYNIAVSTALGKNLNAIIVDTRKTALECIRYLKEQRVGTATFLPLDSLSGSSSTAVADSYRRLGDRIKLVRDVIEIEETYLQALVFACGDALVADTLDDARKVAFGLGSSGKRTKIVTLDGDLLHKNGNMSGGSLRDRKDEISAFDRHKLAGIKARKDELVQSLSTLESSHVLRTREHEIVSQISGCRSRLRFSNQDYLLTVEKLEKNAKSICDVETELKETMPLLKQLRAKLSHTESLMLKTEKSIAKEEDSIFKEFSRKVGFSNIRGYEEQRLAKAKEQADRKVQIANQLSRLKSQIEYQRTRGKKEKITQLEKELTGDRAKLREVQDCINETEKKIQSFQKVAEMKKEEMQASKQALNEASSDIKVLKEELAQCHDDLASAQKLITGLEGEIGKLRQHRADILQSCRLEQVEIPLISTSARHRQRRRSSFIMRQGAENDDFMDVDEIDREPVEASLGQEGLIDYSSLEDQEKIDADEFALRKQRLQDDLSRLSSELEGLAPNMKAIRRFSQVKERMHSVTENFEEAKRVAKQAQDEFAEVRQARIDRFLGSFNHVSDKIDEIYKQLTRSQDFPLGGNAFLSLESVDEPFTSGIKYSAMPPMKRFRDMEQLSGGEKTVAALALLFAIHSFHPSPFFVLDEVDAALDKANVTKIARYVRSRAHEDGLQCVVISLKDTFFDKADALVGVFKDRQSASSGSLTLDLSKYDR